MPSPMPPGNKQYKAAIGKKNVASQPSNRQTTDALRTSIGENTSTITHARPSWEGYQGGAATHLQMNDTGYLNKSAQIARYRKLSKSVSVPLSHHSSSYSGHKPSLTDLRICRNTGSSKDILARKTRLDRII